MRDIIESIKQCLVRFFDSRFCWFDREDDHVRNLLMQLEKERDEKLELLRFVLELINKEEVQEQFEQKDFKPILPKNIPWNIRRAQLEREDREKVKLRNVKVAEAKSTEELEKELLGDQNASKIS